jgi:hypothetical protein
MIDGIRARPGVIALILAVAAFGLYATTMGQLVGYESETAAASEGLVKQGVLQVLPGTPLTAQGLPGRGGHLYSRTGLAQPLMEVPFYFVGQRLDDLTSNGRSYKWRLALLRLFNPLMSTLTVLAVFGLLLLRGRSVRRATGVATLCAIGTLVWPYAKIGMDTTLMATVAVAMLAAAWAARQVSPRRFLIAGIAAAAATMTKPYGLMLLVGMLPLLGEPLRAQTRGVATRALAALVLPVLAAIVAVGWYNAYRTGSVTNFFHANPTQLLSTPFHAAGLLVSPGKGLLFYSPLVALGALGLRELWGEDRPLALAILLAVAVNVLIIAATLVWTDDTWGPRYIIPTAWLLILPIAWWVRPGRRRAVLGLVTGLAVLVQCVGVFSRYDASTVAARRLSGVFVYPIGVSSTVRFNGAYGNDGPAWVPNVSPVLLQSEVLAAWVKQQITGTGFTITYNPAWGGKPGRFDLAHPADALGTPLPDFWWRAPGQTTAQGVFVATIALAGLAAWLCLYRLFRPVARRGALRRPPWPARPRQTRP